MATAHLSLSNISRGKGQSAVAAAAYRSRDRIIDQRTGEMKDYRRVDGKVQFLGIFAPKGSPGWTQDREQLWNEVEAREDRVNSRLAREIELALPHELTPEQNRWLVQDFVRDKFVRKGFVADVAIHAPHSWGDVRNVHAHVMVTTRKVDERGWAEGNKDREQNEKSELISLREDWGKLTNRHLERHGHAARIDMRSLEDQGKAQQPQLHLGPIAAELERRGIATELGEHNRAVETENAIRQQITAEPDLAKRVDLAAARAMDELGAADAMHLLQGPLTAKPQHPASEAMPAEGAIERGRREEAEERRHTRLQGTLGDIAAALWALGKTMGQSLANVFVQRQPERTWVRGWLEDARGRALLEQGINFPEHITREYIDWTAAERDAGRDRSWMARSGGYDHLSTAMKDSARRSYEAWSEREPHLAERFDLPRYVGYAQRQEAAKKSGAVQQEPGHKSVMERVAEAKRQAEAVRLQQTLDGPAKGRLQNRDEWQR